MDSRQLLVAAEEMKKRAVQKKESSLSGMRPTHGIRRTRDRKCGNYITQKLTKARVTCIPDFKLDGEGYLAVHKERKYSDRTSLFCKRTSGGIS